MADVGIGHYAENCLFVSPYAALVRKSALMVVTVRNDAARVTVQGVTFKMGVEPRPRPAAAIQVRFLLNRQRSRSPFRTTNFFQSDS